MNFKRYFSSYPNFPKPGVLFWDFMPLLADPQAFKQAVWAIKERFEVQDLTQIVAIEAKGFTLGAALAYEMGLPLVLIRKAGLIPAKVRQASFVKEYGISTYELSCGSLSAADRCLLIYDILACSGATQAAIGLIESEKASVLGCAYAIELEYLGARAQLKNYDLFSLVKIQEKIHVN